MMPSLSRPGIRTRLAPSAAALVARPLLSTYDAAMHRDILRFMVRFHINSYERVLETTALLSGDEYRRRGPLDHGNPYETLLHVFGPIGVGASF